jgi:peptidoglycan/xylan/chitin deacetylase (PgdA/CDA1 family)
LPIGSPSSPVEPVIPIDGRAARIRQIATEDKVVFLTIDDGIYKDPQAMDFLIENRWPATLFLVAGELKKDPEYFARIFEVGGTISSHTLSHPDLKGLSIEEQTRQICGMAEFIRYGLGQVGHLMRPPYGSYDDTTRRATASCGLNAVVLWNSSLWEGNIDLAGRSSLQPGDIFLTHFRRDLYSNLVALKKRIEAEGFTIGRLEEYLPLG